MSASMSAFQFILDENSEIVLAAAGDRLDRIVIGRLHISFCKSASAWMGFRRPFEASPTRR